MAAAGACGEPDDQATPPVLMPGGVAQRGPPSLLPSGQRLRSHLTHLQQVHAEEMFSGLGLTGELAGEVSKGLKLGIYSYQHIFKTECRREPGPSGGHHSVMQFSSATEARAATAEKTTEEVNPTLMRCFHTFD